MEHLAEEMVVALIEGALSDEEASTVDEHIDSCPDCRSLVTEMVKSSTIRHKDNDHSGEESLDPALEARRSLLVSGEVLAGRFRIVRPLGRGSMGVVYEARDEELDIRLALKVLTPEAAKRPKLLERLRKEIVLGRRITHPNACRLYDLGNADGLHFITMEYLEGETLEELMKKGRLHPMKAWHVCRQVGEALEIAHSHGVIHRDLKPANIMVEPDGTVKVMDFGLALDLHAEHSHVGGAIGTPAYWSPEQARGDRATERSDLYSMAVIYCELATGQRPGWGEIPDMTGIKRAFRPIIEKCLSINPSDRWATVEEVRIAFADAEKSLVPKPPRRPYKRRFLVIATIGGIVLGVAITIAVIVAAT